MTVHATLAAVSLKIGKGYMFATNFFQEEKSLGKYSHH